MEHLQIPAGYHSELNLHDTQAAIKTVKDFFQQTLAEQLNLLRVTAPLFVTPESGLNDNLNGVERPVSFGVLEQDDRIIEVVHSLAKWKRYALKQYGFAMGEGLYTDMNAIRRDETTDNIHSIYVDQWDWEKIIAKEDRNVETLKDTVRKIYKTLKKTEKYMAIRYDYIEEILPKDIFFITTQELEDLYPGLSSKEKEYRITKEKGAVFLMQIGDKISTGEPHDGRAPDYDDWSLNGDILVYYPVLDIALEQMCIRDRVSHMLGFRQDFCIVFGNVKFLLIPGQLFGAKLRLPGTDFLQPGVADDDGHQIRLREIPVVLGVLLGTHGIGVFLVVVPPSRLLDDRLPLFQKLDLPCPLAVDSVGDGLEGVQVLHLRSRTKLLCAHLPDGQVHVSTHGALLEFAVRSTQILDDEPQFFQISDDLVGRTHIRLGYDLDQRHAGTVEVHQGAVLPLVMDELARILLHMDLMDTNNLLSGCRLDLDTTVSADGQI